MAQDHLTPGQGKWTDLGGVGTLIDRQADAYVAANAALFMSPSYGLGIKRSGQGWLLAGGTEYLSPERGGTVHRDKCRAVVPIKTGDRILQLWKKALSHTAPSSTEIVLDGTYYTFATRGGALTGTIVSPLPTSRKMTALVAVSNTLLDVCRSAKYVPELEHQIDQLLPVI